MDGWVDYLHVSWHGEHVLFPSLHLHSFPHFLVASLFTVFLCLLERTLTFALSKRWCPLRSIRSSRVGKAAWLAALYWMVTLCRLLYMLVAMTFNTGIILVTVTALAIGQFVIEFLEEPVPHHSTHTRDHQQDPENVKEPLLRSDDSYGPSVPLDIYPQSYPQYDSPKSATEFNTFYRPYSRSPSPSPQSPPPHGADPFSMSHPDPDSESRSSSRPGTSSSSSGRKSKPTEIFIHPRESNLARADAAALHLGLAGDTERVKGNMYPVDNNAAWEVGKGKDLARELLRKATI